MIWFLGLSTALWLIISYLAFKNGYTKGRIEGYAKAQASEKDRRALMIANAKLAGRFEVWQEVSDMLAEFAEPTNRTVN